MNLVVADHTERFDRYLHDIWPDCSRAKIARWISDGVVTVNGEVRKASFPIKVGMEIAWDELPDREPHNLTPSDIPIPIIFEDASFMVVNKPRGMATHPAPGLKEATLVNALLGRQESRLSTGSAEFRPGIVHRLDKETTGLLMVAKSDTAHEALAKQIEEKSALRRYLGICQGALPEPRLRIEAPIARDVHDRRKMAVHPKGKPAVTHILRLRHDSTSSLFAAQLETGRTHQIRVHLQAAGYPIIGDASYARGDWAKGPMQLHAAMLSVNHPDTGERLTFHVDPPEDFQHWTRAELDALINWDLA